MGHGLEVQLLLFTSKVSVSCVKRPISDVQSEGEAQAATQVPVGRQHTSTAQYAPHE